MLNIIMPLIFIAGILCVALEDKIKINKAAITITMAIILWSILMINVVEFKNIFNPEYLGLWIKDNPSLALLPMKEQAMSYLSDFVLIDRLGDVATTLFFVMATMVIIELVDSQGGFMVVSEKITTRNKRKMLWIICILAFFFSALLDNIAAAVVIIALLRKLITKREDRWIFASMVIIASNAGGSWSPIGDVTTILLWSSGNLTAAHQILSLFLPALATVLVPLIIVQYTFKKGECFENIKKDTYVLIYNNPRFKNMRIYSSVILAMGVISLASVPIFKEFTHLPPFMGVLFGLSLMWIFTDIALHRSRIREAKKVNVVKIFNRIDMATIMFFFGILMSVAAIDTAGQLEKAGEAMSKAISEPLLISFIVGICSSFLDNVALVAATMGMYPLADPNAVGALSDFAVNGDFWTFLAYCGVTGGSILIIGSATGVTVMGMEKITFGYYLKKFTLLAFLGYIAGAVVYLAINSMS